MGTTCRTCSARMSAFGVRRWPRSCRANIAAAKERALGRFGTLPVHPRIYRFSGPGSTPEPSVNRLRRVRPRNRRSGSIPGEPYFPSGPAGSILTPATLPKNSLANLLVMRLEETYSRRFRWPALNKPPTAGFGMTAKGGRGRRRVGNSEPSQ